MSHRTLSVALSLSFAALLGACGGGSNAASPATTSGASAKGEIVAKNLAFDPKSATAAVGEPVVWRFDDGAIPHNVDGDGWKSKNLTKGTYEHTFDKAGTYKYTCNLHSGMNGEVVVK